MTVLIAGGTGRLGHHLVPRLLAHGVAVRVLTRDPRHAADLGEGVEVVVGDVRDPPRVRAAVAGADTVVSAVHGLVGRKGISPATVDRDGNGHLLDAAAEVGAGFVLMSMVGASADHPMELARMKYAAEHHALERGVPTTVVRPTAYAELWIDVLRSTAGRSGRVLVLGRGENPINFVSVVDVAALVETVVMDRSARGAVLEIGGPENLTMNEVARAVHRAEGRDALPRHVPPAALRLVAAAVGSLVPQVGRMVRTALVMDRADLRFDAAPLRHAYPGLPTTSVQEVVAQVASRDAGAAASGQPPEPLHI